MVAKISWKVLRREGKETKSERRYGETHICRMGSMTFSVIRLKIVHSQSTDISV